MWREDRVDDAVVHLTTCFFVTPKQEANRGLTEEDQIDTFSCSNSLIYRLKVWDFNGGTTVVMRTSC